MEDNQADEAMFDNLLAFLRGDGDDIDAFCREVSTKFRVQIRAHVREVDDFVKRCELRSVSFCTNCGIAGIANIVWISGLNVPFAEIRANRTFLKLVLLFLLLLHVVDFASTNNVNHCTGLAHCSY